MKMTINKNKKTINETINETKPKTNARTITITPIIDIVGALADGTLSKNLYLLDNNKANGSSGEGTETLKTMVEEGDQLIWSIMSLEPEAFASITDIVIDSAYCEPQQRTYPGSDVVYWFGQVKKNLKTTPYSLKIKVGNRDEELLTSSTPCLVGRSNP